MIYTEKVATGREHLRRAAPSETAAGKAAAALEPKAEGCATGV